MNHCNHSIRTAAGCSGYDNLPRKLFTVDRFFSNYALIREAYFNKFINQRLIEYLCLLAIEWGRMCNHPSEDNLLHFVITWHSQNDINERCKSYLINLKVSTNVLKSCGSIVVLPSIDQHFCTNSDKYFRVSCWKGRQTLLQLCEHSWMIEKFGLVKRSRWNYFFTRLSQQKTKFSLR